MERASHRFRVGEVRIVADASGSLVLFVDEFVPRWISLRGDNSEYWIARDAPLYLGLATLGSGIVWSAAVVAGRGEAADLDLLGHRHVHITQER